MSATTVVKKPGYLPAAPVKRRAADLSPVPGSLAELPRAPWADIADPAERLRASMLWNCDEWHRRGRTDLAKSLSEAFRLDWRPVIGARQYPKTAALPFEEPAETTPAPDLNAADYDPFAKGS